MDNSKKNYKSHVLLCQGLMRSYVVRLNKLDGDEVYYWDLQDDNIKHKKIKEVDAEEQYFDKVVEDFLADQIESKFFDIVDKLRRLKRCDIDAISKIITKESLSIIRDFFKYSLVRNKETFANIKRKSVFADGVMGFTHSVVIAYADALKNKFADTHISIIINTTSHKFVCPHSIIYYVYRAKTNNYELVISANKNIAFCLDLEQKNNQVEIIEAKDKESIECLNMAAYMIEKRHHNPYIIGSKEDLLVLKENCIKHQEVLDDGRYPIILNV